MPFRLVSDMGEEIPYTKSVFSGGEIQTRLDPDRITRNSLDWDHVTITAHMREASEIMELAMLASSVREYSRIWSKMIIPYLPYSRQDRICRMGEDFALRTFSEIVNNCGFQKVITWDVHSDVAKYLIADLENVEAKHFVSKIRFEKPPIVVAPDKGARIRAGECSNVIGNGFIQAEKARSVDNSFVTIQLEDPDVGYHIPPGEDFLIVDDICDGGRTFIELAKILRPLSGGRIMLYVTHGIFSQGLKVFGDLISDVFCPNVWEENIEEYTLTKLHRISGE
jgi:ribose-phosphate pyrophosphokinase